jgi:Rac GTPase-activating protein 1
MAREEYDREVAARRDAEFEMLRLKDQMKEQASKLGAMDELHKKQELLQRRSNDLRNSVLGYEQELSKMRVERDMTVAEMEELAGLPKSSDEAALAPERLSVALSSRLSSLKDEYRSDLEALTSERDALRVEVEELKQSKDLFTEESGLLNKRNTEIADETTEAIRNLDAIKLELAQAQNLLATIKRDRAAALRSGSSSLKSSVGSTATTTGTASASVTSQNMSSSVSSTRHQPITPTPPVDDQPAAFIAQKVEQVFPQATVRKFK